MRRYAFKYRLKPGCAEEYKKRHDEIWPELVERIHLAGMVNYSIFLDSHTNLLFCTYEQQAATNTEWLANDPVVRKWQRFMADIMEVNHDGSIWSKPLAEMFHKD
jgi:L-rhamnose mutarotase